jgi:methyl-accepting chemotaxis protein
MKATVRARLTIGFLALVTIGSVASVAILAILSGTIDELKRVVTVSDTVEHKALEMRFDMLAMSDAMRGFLINPASTAERTRKKQADEHFEAVVEEIRKLAPQGEILGLLQTAADMDSRTLNRIEDELLAQIAAGDAEGAKARYAAEYLPLRQKQEGIIGDIEKETIRLKEAALSSAENSYAVARATTWVLVVGVTALGLALSFFLARSLARPIVRMAASMTRAARGDLSDVLEFDDRTDELGDLSRSINGTYRYLQEMSSVATSLAAGDLRVRVTPRSDDDGFGQAFVSMLARLAQVIGEVRAGANALSGASNQVSASSQTLSQGTSEQAASVQETTSSLEQMSASITQSAASSKQTEQMAVQGARDAAEGGQAVAETIDAMRAIAEKISIIEEIAYQTNLLALNAAIEAARARRARPRLRRGRHGSAQAGGEEPGRGQGHRLAGLVEHVAGRAVGPAAGRPGAFDPQDRGPRAGGGGGLRRAVLGREPGQQGDGARRRGHPAQRVGGGGARVHGGGDGGAGAGSRPSRRLLPGRRPGRVEARTPRPVVVAAPAEEDARVSLYLPDVRVGGRRTARPPRPC